MRFEMGVDGPGGLSRRSMLLGLMVGATSVRTQGQQVSSNTEGKTESSMPLGSPEPSTMELTCKPTIWRDRQAYVLENDLIRLVTLTGGGHIAEFRFREESGLSKVNPLWNPPWRGIEPYLYRDDVHAAQYGAPPTGQLLSGIVGHNLCLDYFGGPSEEEAKLGLPIHGEAGISLWQKMRAEAKGPEAILEMSVKLPVAGLSFTRQIKIRRGESLA